MKKTARWAIVLMTVLVGATGCGTNMPNATSSPRASTASPTYGTPAGRRDAAVAYDPQSRRLLMFGGGTASTPLSDTWAWDGKGWIELHPATVPSGGNPFMAYNVQTRRLELFLSSETGIGLWSWSNGDWTERAGFSPPNCSKTATGTVCSPAVPANPAGISSLTYDPALNRILVLAPGAETWTFDGNGLKWQQVTTTHRVSSYLCCLTYATASKQVLYLGNGGKSGEINQTWVFDGSDWTLSSAQTPTGQQTEIVDDPAAAAVLMVRGSMDDPAATDTWLWKATTWERLNAPSPPASVGFTLGYDPAHKQVLLFGGLDRYGSGVSDTWLWDGHTWKKAGG